MQTTLKKIKSHSPCVDGWIKLLNHLGKTDADDEVLELRTILESNGIKDTLWAFRAVALKSVNDVKIRLFAADCAEMVLPIYEKEYPNDYRPRKAIYAARDYANRLISAGELVAALAAQRAAADAAMTAQRTAADAALAAQRAAASAAADAGMTAKEAADAALAAQRAAASAAADAGMTAKEAADAAWDEIKSLLLKYI